MIVNAKLAGHGGGSDNIKSWIAKVPDDSDVSFALNNVPMSIPLSSSVLQ